MKVIISNAGDHKTMIEVRELKTPPGYFLLRFTSQDSGASSPKIETDEVLDFEIMLSSSQLKNLKDIL